MWLGFDERQSARLRLVRVTAGTLAVVLAATAAVGVSRADAGKLQPEKPLSVYCLAGCSNPPHPERVLTMRPLPTAPLSVPRPREDVIVSGITYGPEPYGSCRGLSYPGWRYWKEPGPFRAVIEVYRRD